MRVPEPNGHEHPVKFASELACGAEADQKHQARETPRDEVSDDRGRCGSSEVGLGGKDIFHASFAICQLVGDVVSLESAVGCGEGRMVSLVL